MPRLTFRDLPTRFITRAEAETRTGRGERSIRNDCLERGIALKVRQPSGGLEWAIHEAGHDTGLADDIRAYVARLDGLEPGDTGPLLDAHRDWPHLSGFPSAVSEAAPDPPLAEVLP